MKWTVTILAALGGVLPLIGIGLGARRVIVDFRELGRKLDEVEQIMKDPRVPEDVKMARAKKVLQPEFTWARLTYTYEWIRYLVLRNAVTDLRGAAVSTGLGVVCGTIASVWSLWLT